MPIEPLDYHLEMIRHLQRQEPDLWKWFSADRLRQQQNEAARLDLLKTTYRIEPDANPPLYAAAALVSAVLGLAAPITCYQSQSVSGLNASLAYMPGEAHLVLVGPVLSTLTDVELRAVLGHELLHFAMLDRWRDYMIAAQVLAAMSNDAAAQSCHIASARLFKLYTEVCCDRGAYLASRDLNATITALVKIETSTTDVSAESYLRQADEIFAKGHPRAEGVTHPETFIRAKAIKLWVDQPHMAAMEIRRVIEGPLALEELDLLGQQQVCGLSRRLINKILQPQWLQTEATLAHTKLFFEDFELGADGDRQIIAELSDADDKIRDFACYLLLDFATADRDLEEAPLAAMLLLSDELGLGERFRQLTAKELNLRKKQMQALETDASRIVAEAAKGED